ncbi:MAG: hypothetical protein ACLFUS_05915 [Candidatus Sumerlaeia bacterium]
MNPLQKNRPLAFYFLLIFFLAFLVRVNGIDRFPPGLWFDEGLNGVDAWNSLHGGGLKLVYPDVFPREPMLVWLLSIVLFVFGPQVLVMRLLMVLIGSLSCVFFLAALLGLRRGKSLAFALCAAFALATLHWHAWFSRLVFRTNLVPLFACLALAAMAWAARRNYSGRSFMGRWLLAGLVIGAGFYTYLAWYFFLPVILVWLWALHDNEDNPFNWPLLGFKFLHIAIGALIIAFPLGLHYAMHPEHLAGRPQAVSPFQDGWWAGLLLILENLRDVLLMFSIRGDHVALHNVAEIVGPDSPRFGKTGTPVLDPAWSLFFYVGLAAAIVRVFRKKREWRQCIAWLVWLLCMSLPSVFSQTDSANTLRNLGVTPAVAWMVAYGFQQLRAFARRFQQPWRRVVNILLLALLIWGAGFQVYKLLVRHPAVPGIADRFNAINVHLAELTEADPEGAPLFVADMFRNKTFEFMTIGRDDIRTYDFDAVRQAQESPPRDHRVLCTIYDDHFRRLKSLFPDAYVEEDKLYMGDRPFAWVLRIPASSLQKAE